MTDPPAGVTPELWLVACCCRWPDGEARRQAIAAAAAAVIDWTAVADLAEAHRIEGLVSHGLASAGIAAPPAVGARIAGAAAAIRAINLTAIADMLRIDRALRVAGIRGRFIKGVPLGIRCYATPTLKRSWDLDLLVDPAEAVAAGAMLRSLGYREFVPARLLDRAQFKRWSAVSREVIYAAPGRTHVELHWRLADWPGLLDGSGAVLPSASVPVLGEQAVETLADEPCLAFLAVHGASHGWSRLKWLADCGALVAARPPAKRLELVQGAMAHAPGNALAQFLRLADRWLGLAVDERLLSAAGDRPQAARLARRAERVIAARRKGVDIENDRAAQLLILRCHFDLAPGIAHRLGVARHRLRGTLDRERFPLPAWLNWLYWPMRPFTGAANCISRRFPRNK